KVSSIKVSGTLHIDFLFVHPSHSASLLVDSATITGTVKLGYSNSAIAGSIVSPQTSLQNFRFDSDNFGFPCCVDDIATNYLRPKIQEIAQSAVAASVPRKVGLALSQLKLPASVHFGADGSTLDVTKSFDSAEFDSEGGTVTAKVHFYHDDA